MKLKRQLDAFYDYEAFVKKFKPKPRLTTDDCMTPDNIYQVVVDWVVEEYGIDPGKIVRPFWPGGNYEDFDYPDDCIVLDNPPFSILSKIVADYLDNGIKFFLFSPTLTNFETLRCCHIVIYGKVTYANGAVVNTSFITNLDDAEVMSVPELQKRIEQAEAKGNRKRRSKHIYPPEVLMSTMVAKYSKYGVDFRLMPEQCHFVRALDSQRAAGTGIYGAGYLLSEKAAAAKYDAEYEAELNKVYAQTEIEKNGS